MPPPALPHKKKKAGRFDAYIRANARDVFSKTVFCLLLVFICGQVLSVFFHAYERLNPSASKIEDTHLSDLFFAYLNKKTIADTNIIIIDCSNNSRGVIADKIDRICRSGPKVLGIDVVFTLHSSDTAEDMKLAGAIYTHRSKIVLADVGGEEEKNNLDSPFYSILGNRYLKDTPYRFGSLPKEDLLKIKRYYRPFEHGRKNSAQPFAMAILAAADYKCDTLIRRHPDTNVTAKEVIDFKKTISGRPRYAIFDTVPSDSVIAGKIVLLGSWNTKSIDDNHYTPLNGELGRSLPDMPGIEYQAQIMSMLIADHYINEPSYLLRCFLILLITFLLMFRFDHVHHKYPHSGHIRNELTTVLLIGPVIFCVFGYIFVHYQYLLEPNHFILPLFFSCMFLDLYETKIGKGYKWVFKKIRQWPAKLNKWFLKL